MASGCVLLVLCTGWIACIRADEAAKPLTAEERAQLQKEAAELDKTALRLYRDGQYDAVTDVLEKSLAIQRKLYPTDLYPNGRPEVAVSLSTLAHVYKLRGEYDKAEALYREALEILKRLFPDGHPDLATNLNNLGFVLDERGEYAQAEPFYREALAMCRRLYPADKYPNGHPGLAQSIINLGYMLDERGEYAKAEPLYREALAMLRRLYPADKYPNGRSELAASLGNLGALLQSRGEPGKAEPFCREAMEMCRRLYPANKYPNGHPQLAVSLENLGYLSKVEGDYDKAAEYYGDALDIYLRLYPKKKYPNGRPELAAAASNLGGLMEQRGEYDKAERLYQEALAMRRRLYPAEKYPAGHPDLAGSLNNLGALRRDRQEYGDAETYYRDALKMRRRLYPAEKYPAGHPDLAQSLNNLGELLVVQGKYDQAAEVLAKGLAMYDRLMAAFAASAAEAEAINLAASRPRIHSGYLAATAHTKESPADSYGLLWRGKGGLARTQEQRRRLLRAASTADAGTRRKVQTLIETRQDLARLILAPPGRSEDADRAALLQELTDQKERLEKELAGVLPASERATASYTDLADHLPDKTAFIDCYRYWNWNLKTRQWDELHYTAFVLRKDQPVRRVELDQGAVIESDLKQWRQDIDKNFASDAAGRLRTNLWAPIAKVLGDEVQTVYVCPDGALNALPWAALPADRPGHVLLEDYAFAVVPSGPFLLEQQAHPLRRVSDGGELLAVGGVAYDRAGVPADKAGKPWPPLPATDKERAAVVAQAGKLPLPSVVELSGLRADVSHVLAELPKARWTHLATHGFFADKGSQERKHLFRPDDFMYGVGMERRGAAARNPLTLSGLVLAGANQPTDADSGILSGEAVAGLNLDAMDLAVLSACQTGLGEAAAGEGVFGLQRAYHIGGARNVVASLWKVNDEATAALMNQFYYYLWAKGEPPLQALRHAQLELYRHPQAMPALAKRGAIDFDETMQTVTKAPTGATETAAVRDWAAFVLSGAGQ